MGQHKIYTVNGFTGNLRKIAEHFGINYNTLYRRITRSNMSIEDAVNYVSKMQNGKAKIYTVNGFTGNIMEISKHFGINYRTLRNRLQNGMTIEEAISKPIDEKYKGKIYTVNGFTGNIMEISKHFGISYHSLLYRLLNGMLIEDAVNADINVVKIYTVNGFTGNKTQIAEHFGINKGTLLSRIHKGASIQEAVDAGPKMQKKNSKIYTVNGFTGNRVEIAKHFGINYQTLSRKIQNGVSIQEAVDAGPKMQNGKAKIYTVNGFTGNMSEIAEHFGISYAALASKIYRGMSIEDAVNSGTKMQNGKTKIYTVNGFTGSIAKIAEHFGINYTTLRKRLASGIPIEEAVNAGPKMQKTNSKIYTINGFTGNIREIAEHFNINYAALRSRIYNGMSIEEAVNGGSKIHTGNSKIYTVNGFIGNIMEISEHFGINYHTLLNRLQNGMSIEDAVNAGAKMYTRKSKIYTVNGFTGSIREISEHFGINYSTLNKRITQSNMTIEDAINAGSRMKTGYNPKICTVNGFTGNIKQIAKHFGINYRTLRKRLQKGMSIEYAVNVGAKMYTGNAKIYTVNGFTGSIREIADHFGINYQTLLRRLKSGMTVEKAVTK